ncbi:MAG TPA: hypothetical protein VJQ26_03595, partial [Ktedonobacteraceae bacterium]|nr:hypothetical protein [Ktedonobacteraceae bacterium]
NGYFQKHREKTEFVNGYFQELKQIKWWLFGGLSLIQCALPFRHPSGASYFSAYLSLKSEN